MKLQDALPGTKVVINTSRDHWFEADKRKFMSFNISRGDNIESRLIIMEVSHVTKGGLIACKDGKGIVTFAPYNVDLLDDSIIQERYKDLIE